MSCFRAVFSACKATLGGNENIPLNPLRRIESAGRRLIRDRRLLPGSHPSEVCCTAGF